MVPTTQIVASDLTRSRLCLGLSRLHHLPRADAHRRLIDAALDLGVSHFDIARLYGEARPMSKILAKFVNRHIQQQAMCTSNTRSYIRFAEAQIDERRQ